MAAISELKMQVQTIRLLLVGAFRLMSAQKKVIRKTTKPGNQKPKPMLATAASTAASDVRRRAGGVAVTALGVGASTIAAAASIRRRLHPFVVAQVPTAVPKEVSADARPEHVEADESADVLREQPYADSADARET